MEYQEAFRTKSYVDIWSKAQFQLRANDERLSPLHLSDFLLEPQQETLLEMIDDCNPHTLVLDYFNGSLEACRICGFLLQCINQARANYHKIQKVLQLTKRTTANYTKEQCQFITKEFVSFADLQNPLSGSNELYFNRIHELYGCMLKQLVTAHKKIKRKAEVIKFGKKAARVSVVVACGALTAVSLVLVTHACIGLIATPIIISSSTPFLKRKYKSVQKIKARSLERLKAQLDAAAKGAYIIDRDFDTMSRLTTRLHNEIEHNKAIIRICMRPERKSLLKEVVKELQNNEACFLEQLEELEEHVYLCFLTINRTRRLIIEEMAVNEQHKDGTNTKKTS